MVAEASINAFVAQLIYEARTSSGLTQKQIAELVGTKQPVIARLEDADYEGHSLSGIADRRYEFCRGVTAVRPPADIAMIHSYPDSATPAFYVAKNRSCSQSSPSYPSDSD